MNGHVPASFRNGQAVRRAELPVLPVEQFREAVLAARKSGARLVTLHGERQGERSVRLHAVTANGHTGQLEWRATDVGAIFPAITPDWPAAHLFEREIAEQWGVRPDGHPCLKPVRFHHSYLKDTDAWDRPADLPIAPGVTNFFSVDGEEVHEVAVGPVHAGIIEPGHFRFHCHGEQVFSLEIALGFQHRGIERALVGGPDRRTPHYMETAAGDTTIGHSLAYAQAVEALSGCKVPARAQVVRAIALELERLANHTGDLGALAGDIGFLPTSSFCGRIRGEFLNLTAVLCGNRFGRGLVRPGGVAFDVNATHVERLRKGLDETFNDAAAAINLLWNTSSVRARFENAGTVTRENAEELGLVGVVARSSGVEMDVRHEFPQGAYQFAQIPISTYPDGNVFARAFVRWLEMQRSVAFLRDQLQALPAGPISAGIGSLAPDTVAVSLTEGWRGEICHSVLTDSHGRFACYKIVDPSFHNWMGLALAMRGQQISDFPLCNKSFNLSYCGHDL